MKELALIVILAISQATPPVPRRTAATSGQGSDNSKNQSQQNQKNPPTPTFVAPFKQTPTAEHHSDEVTPNNSHNSVELTRIPPVTIIKDKKSFWGYVFDWGPWVFSLFLAGVGTWQVLLLFRTLGAIKRQADLMERQANGLDKSVTIAERAAVVPQLKMESSPVKIATTERTHEQRA
jgi:hypothetical protein